MATLTMMDQNLRSSFERAKKDVMDMSNTLSGYNEAVRQLSDNQKTLLLRIRELEHKVAELAARPVPAAPVRERIIERNIAVTAAKVAPQQVFVGSSTGRRLHDPVCPFAKNIMPKNKVVFQSKLNAYNQGYRPCDCLKHL